MVQMLIVGLVWLFLTALLCLVIGRALRAGDAREEKRSRGGLPAFPPAEMIARSHGGAIEAGLFSPELVRPVDDEELDRWGELWRWEDELRRGVDLWCEDADSDAWPDGPPRPDRDDLD